MKKHSGHLVEFLPNECLHGVKHIDAVVFNRLNEFKQAQKSKNKIDVSIKITSNEMTFEPAKGQLKEVAKRKPKANINDVHIFIGEQWRKYNYKNLAK